MSEQTEPKKPRKQKGWKAIYGLQGRQTQRRLKALAVQKMQDRQQAPGMPVLPYQKREELNMTTKEQRDEIRKRHCDGKIFMELILELALPMVDHIEVLEKTLETASLLLCRHGCQECPVVPMCDDDVPAQGTTCRKTCRNFLISEAAQG